MAEIVSSTLNPSANVFVPGKNPILKDATNREDISAPLWTISKTNDSKNCSIKEIAKQLVVDYVAKKRNRGEETITKQEIIAIFKKVLSKSNIKINMRFEALFSKFPDVGKLKDVETDNEAINYCTAKPFTFDLSVFKLPKLPVFLSSLYGLYRHEQAVRPLLSLTLPPSNLEDNLWSLTPKDLSLWNPYCGEPCSCPPVFGYSIPPSFFGNLFNLDYKCSKNGFHFCRYPPSENGNESMLIDTKPDYSIEVKILEDWIEDECEGESNFENYSEQLKTIVSRVCDSISETTKESKASLINDYDYEVDENFTEMFWDANPLEWVRSDEVLEDDNIHPLLEMNYMKKSEGVPAEIEEMIRKCLTSDKMDDSKESDVDEGIDMGYCNSPCSNWCRESPKFERSDSVSSSSSVSANIGLLKDTTDFLLNASKGSIPLKGETCIESRFHKRNFKRSFSANDCDLSCEERFKINCQVPQFSSTREDLEFLRKDPINFFKSLRKGSSWEDDSGIVSHWSSREEIDVYSDSRDGFYDQDHAPMWSLFNAEDSLWKPLPDCAQQDQHSKFMPKRVRDLRRQRSMN